MVTSLATRLAQDLDQSFPELVDRHGPMVLTLACRLTDRTTGQDITQDVFLRAYRALSSYTPERITGLEVRPWLATVTRNLVRNEYRRRGRKGTVPLVESDGTSDDDSHTTVEATEALDRVNTMLGCLSQPQREAVVLRHIVGLPIREVALTMACPEGTAKSHVSRGLDRLRTQLTPQHDLKGESQ